MDNKYTIINDLVVQACERLRKMGLSIDDGAVESMVHELYSRDASIAQITQQVAEMENSRRTQFEIQKTLADGLDIAWNLQNLDVQHMGITLNSQDIDLMMIASSNSFEELELAMSKITNISMPPLHENEGFIEYRQRIFDSYLGALSHENEALIDRGLNLQRKLEGLAKSGTVTKDEMDIIYQIIAENKEKGTAAIFDSISSRFGEEKVREILLTMRDYDLISKEGISRTSLEASQGLYSELSNKYDSITIDEEAKYGKVILADGTFDGRHLVKALDFAKSMGKTVRINTLVFYMDCPDDVYNLEESPTSTRIAKDKLTYYVDETTKVLAQYGDTVRSVDVFNELLNRHPMVGNVPYMLRGDIPQDMDEESLDNIKAGWLKHLSVEDICDVLVTARANLPNVDFMYNDDHLIDPAKLESTVELIKRIQDYEKTLGVKLIDSIGTQMHIDNNVSKEQIRNMFIELSKLGLPIEVTEFDLAMTSEMEGLSPEEIEVIRQKKINEVYEVITELRDECQIRGFTVWSKTDSQNFRVKIANEALVGQGKEPTVESLHGGFYTEGMIPKSEVMAKKLEGQNFNYHGHTSRCGHAPGFDEQSYIDAAREEGITRIGFSDHAPTAAIESWQYGDKMYIDEASEYIGTVRRLQQENPDMTIRCGFEAECSSINIGHLVELREQCDYMILGQHYVSNGFVQAKKHNNTEYPLIYAKSVCDALDTGIFDILAHPDIFMAERDSFRTEEEKAAFLENARKASYMICLKAKEMGIPIELNAHGVDAFMGGVTDENGHKVTRGSDGLCAYPHPLFWEIAKEVGVDVIYGADAHSAEQILGMYEDRVRMDEFVETTGLNLVGNDYDPVKARENNMALQEAYEETKSTAVMEETAMVSLILSTVKIEEGQDVREKLDSTLASFADRFSKSTEDMSSMTELQRQRMMTSDRLKLSALEFARGYVAEAYEMGCTTQEEYVRAVSLMSEVKNQSDPIKMANASSELSEMRESKQSEKGSQNTNASEKPKVYTYKPTDSGNSDGGNTDGGFTNSLNLLLAIGLLMIFGFAVVYFIK